LQKEDIYRQSKIVSTRENFAFYLLQIEIYLFSWQKI
jgi:hypothetical protein